MSTKRTPREVLERYCDAFARRAPEEIAPLFAENAVFDLPLHEGRIHGREAIMREIRTAVAGLKDINIALDHVIEDESDLFAEGVFGAEHIGIPPHVDGTPSRLDFKFVAVVELVDGRDFPLVGVFRYQALEAARTCASLPDHAPIAVLGRCGGVGRMRNSWSTTTCIFRSSTIIPPRRSTWR